MMAEHRKPNEATVVRLMRAASHGMAEAIRTDPLCADASSAEVFSSAVSLASTAIIAVLEQSLPEDLAQNRQQVQQALMTMLMSTSNGEVPQ